ncbi:alkanesulfonate monooxygenase SsuD/methylene tetrahydromethanopterin reductase-like flavin-dependent oxidoreductase (luciferase family) [Sphaerotilus hippei]|uniref:Alkanesulfonate monooxygenase SsuD/methylene tetrahydromethanopterin reductase-like flavin-dependent oxidoreductase (Luciferase family) n=1 Tax=Sphaerotilus hippei TaxID=744406 RepID=A0A318GXB7_9BURK|nr:LLM class flavin-dependent oxidoreductase [Sphaerotilus hippei]PXW94375.1 alkanesulfonate monooxygenase SsuD/methylene tetrahydromethanopterin reductase-like flavin-dependent oxidoreductase (luciferase family) [Sphaerotilus hippei]
MHPKLSCLCLFENPTVEDGRALIRQFVLVREADRMGYDEIWIGEQHGDVAWPTGAITALLGHLAGVTSKARIGALPLVPALHAPLRLAEDLATLDLLGKGRLQVGVASGRAFPETLKAHGIAADEAGKWLRSSLAELRRLMASGRVVPRPVQVPWPMWLAADDPQSLAVAASEGLGLIAAATHTDARIRAMLASHRAAGGRADPGLVIARFACPAATREQAEAIARPYFEDLVARAQARGWGADPHRSMAGDVEALMACSLVGSHADVAEGVRRLGREFGATSVAIAPTSAQFDTAKHILADMVDEVRPLLEDE